MKDEETGLEIYGIPNAETRAAMNDANEISSNHSARFNSAEELSTSLEDGTIKAFMTHWAGSGGVVYSTREEAMSNCKDGQLISEVKLKICAGPPML